MDPTTGARDGGVTTAITTTVTAAPVRPPDDGVAPLHGIMVTAAPPAPGEVPPPGAAAPEAPPDSEEGQPLGVVAPVPITAPTGGPVPGVVDNPLEEKAFWSDGSRPPVNRPNALQSNVP